MFTECSSNVLRMFAGSSPSVSREFTAVVIARPSNLADDPLTWPIKMLEDSKRGFRLRCRVSHLQ